MQLICKKRSGWLLRSEGTMHSLAYVVTLFSIPILATIICFVVTRIWDE